MQAGFAFLQQGRILRPADLALAAVLGVARMRVHRRLRVGALSTGDELLTDPGAPSAPHQIYDAKRPMLLEIARKWGHAPVDLGHVPDNPDQIAQAQNAGAESCDAILTSGGASAGDEDHVSRFLRETGTLSSWRIALKPGRPLALALALALALWNGVPVFGLPGNPVAALVCALFLGRPALSLMAGSRWCKPQAFDLPAASSKNKKPGPREYLRARLNESGQVEIFASEGSGRIRDLAGPRGWSNCPMRQCRSIRVSQCAISRSQVSRPETLTPDARPICCVDGNEFQVNGRIVPVLTFRHPILARIDHESETQLDRMRKA